MGSADMAHTSILTNAILVLPDRTLSGTLILRGENIVEIAEGQSHASGALDLEGDYLLPGIVDLHTDNLERQVQPRPNARWPSRSALVSHDAQCAAAGVTTVLDALCVGDLGFERGRLQTCRDGVADLDWLEGTNLLKAEHFLHLRCELPACDLLDMLDEMIDHKRLRMASLMDHTPGSGQYANVEYYRAVRRPGVADEAELDRSIADLLEQRDRMRGPNRRGILARFAGRGVVLASHDDRTAEEVAENAALGIRISEFPTTREAAEAAHAHGMAVIAGAPNLVRGGSHSGNVAASELLDAGLVDDFASDYVPPALIEAAFQAAGRIGLPEAAAMITANPAALAGLADRGRLQAGLRADLLRVRLHQGMPVVRQVWAAGHRVA